MSIDISKEAATNTDREIYRETEGDFYADRIHVTKDGGIGINVGGTTHVKPLKDWHAQAARIAELEAENIRLYRGWNAEKVKHPMTFPP